MVFYGTARCVLVDVLQGGSGERPSGLGRPSQNRLTQLSKMFGTHVLNRRGDALAWAQAKLTAAWRRGCRAASPVDFRRATIAELIAIGDGVPVATELGDHLCYGGPADEHVIRPKEAGVMVELVMRSPPAWARSHEALASALSVRR